MSLVILSPTRCRYNSVPIQIVTPSKYAYELFKELRIGGYVCYLKGILTLDELFHKYWNNLTILDDDAKRIFNLAAHEYMQIHYPEDLL